MFKRCLCARKIQRHYFANGRLRRLDALLEPTKEAVLSEIDFQINTAGRKELDGSGLRDASGYVFYNTSKWTLQKLYHTTTNPSAILEANFTEYLNGFSQNVIEIIDKFKLKAQIKHMASKDVLLDVLEKFTSRYINLTDKEAIDPDGKKLPPLTNRAKSGIYLYGKEINDETYVIYKSDMMIKGNDPKNIKNGSTLSLNEFAGMKLTLCSQTPLRQIMGERAKIHKRWQKHNR